MSFYFIFHTKGRFSTQCHWKCFKVLLFKRTLNSPTMMLKEVRFKAFVGELKENCNKNSNFFCFGKQRQIILFNRICKQSIINSICIHSPCSWILRRGEEKYASGPFFRNIFKIFPGGFLSPGKFIAPGIFHHELLRWGNGKEVHFSSTYHHLFDTCLHVDNHTHFTELENHCSL